MRPVSGILIRDALYTTEGVESATGLGRDSLRDARRENRLPLLRMAGRNYYRGADLIRWIEEAATSTNMDRNGREG